jgi:hypothetical protein
MLLLPHKRGIAAVKDFLPTETVMCTKDNVLCLLLLLGVKRNGNK